MLPKVFWVYAKFKFVANLIVMIKIGVGPFKYQCLSYAFHPILWHGWNLVKPMPESHVWHLPCSELHFQLWVTLSPSRRSLRRPRKKQWSQWRLPSVSTYIQVYTHGHSTPLNCTYLYFAQVFFFTFFTRKLDISYILICFYNCFNVVMQTL